MGLHRCLLVVQVCQIAHVMTECWRHVLIGAVLQGMEAKIWLPDCLRWYSLPDTFRNVASSAGFWQKAMLCSTRLSSQDRSLKTTCISFRLRQALSCCQTTIALVTATDSLSLEAARAGVIALLYRVFPTYTHDIKLVKRLSLADAGLRKVLQLYA